MENETLTTENKSSTEGQTPLKGKSKSNDEVIQDILSDLSKQAAKTERQETLVFLGFIILLVMVATMVVAVLALFIGVLKDNNSNNNHYNSGQYRYEEQY